MIRKSPIKLIFLLLLILSCLSYFVVVFAEAASTEKIPIVSVEASSFETGEQFNPEKTIDGDFKTRWGSKWSDPQWLAVDLGEKKTVEKVILHWEDAYAQIYQVQVSVDGKKWYVVHSAIKEKKGKDEISFDPVSVRFLRMYGIKRKTGWGYSVYEFEVFSSSSKPVPLSQFKALSEFRYKPSDLMPDAYHKVTADLLPEGVYPIWLTNQQGYWTITGTADGYFESLICEDGAIELYPRGWSLIPYLYVNDRLITRAEAEVTQSLEEDYLPIPSVKWVYKGLTFKQKMFSCEDKGKAVTYIWYQLTNAGSRETKGKLFLTLRPFQVTPSWQGEGGMTDLFSIEFDKGSRQDNVLINGKDLLCFVASPDKFGALSYLEGDIMDFIEKGKIPPHKVVYDPWGSATGVLEYYFRLAPGESVDYLFAAPVEEKADGYTITQREFFEQLEATRSFWKEKLNRIEINIPDKYLINVLKSNIAYMLINKDGPVIQPGSRHYERSWIRDGAVMGIGLMRMGYLKEAREYIDWIANHQLFNGDVPCMINADGSMWDWGKTLPEYDGQGAFITLISEYYKFTKDKEFLNEKMPNVIKALEFLEYLRKKRLTDEYKNGPEEKKIFYGILPNSVSHEGYPAPGVHSYWDDFWALKGWREAISMAKVLGRDDLLPWMEKEDKDFRKCFYDSIKLVQKLKKIDYIPGCADLGDFDACATAIAVWPADEYRNLPLEQLEFTFDKYYNDTLIPRMRGECDPEKGYVSYEIRTATAYLILGHKKKALKMLEHFLSVTRPREWNHWAEVVYGNYRQPGYIGDMPHSWVGSDYINLIRPMFVFEEGDKLILGAGIDEKWLLGEEGVSIKNFPTHFGKISYAINKDTNILKIKVWGDAFAPDGFVFKSPLAKNIKRVKLNGKEWLEFNDSEVKFEKLPAEIKVYY